MTEPTYPTDSEIAQADLVQLKLWFTELHRVETVEQAATILYISECINLLKMEEDSQNENRHTN